MNTQAVPKCAMTLPAISGPKTRDMFIETLFSASAAESCARGTNSGTMAENKGHRIAKPKPLANIKASSKLGFITPKKVQTLNNIATPETHI